MKIRKNNAFMYGKDAIDPNEQIAIYNSSNDTLPHQHNFIELIYFQKGTGMHFINGDSIPVSGGNIYLLNTNVKHSYQINDENNDTGIVVKNCIFYSSFLGEQYRADSFLQDFWETAFPSNKDAPKKNFIYICNDHKRMFASLFEIIEYELYTKKDNYLVIVKHCLETILLRLLRAYKNTEIKSSYSIATPFIELAVEYIDKHYNEHLTIEKLANIAGYSPIYFSKLFKEYTSYTVRSYLQKLRCQKACELLTTTDLNVQAICGAVGYSDFKQFYYLFKKYIGVTPKQYRQTTKK